MRIATIGDNVIDIYTADSQGYVGGNCVNVAVFARRAGAQHAAYFGVVGTDGLGLNVLEALREEGVDTSGVRVRDGVTAWCQIEHVDGDRLFVQSEKGVSLFRVDDEILDALSEFDVAHMAYSGRMEDDVELVSRRVPVSFDFSDRHSASYIAKIAPFVTYAVFSGGNLDEAGCRRLAQQALDAGAAHVLISRGQDGALYWEDDAEPLRSAALAINVTDTLGAGDTLIASFLVGIGSGIPAARALEEATAHAAKTCMTKGGFGAPLPLSSFSSPSTLSTH